MEERRKSLNLFIEKTEVFGLIDLTKMAVKSVPKITTPANAPQTHYR
jgi:hypothetical protein